MPYGGTPASDGAALRVGAEGHGKQETASTQRRAMDRTKTILAADSCLVQVEARVEGDAH
jgi:hypothetical protein